MMQRIALLPCLATTLRAAGDQTQTTGTVTAEFIGSSGGLKLYPFVDTNKFLMVQQSKLEEVTASGQKVASLQMSGDNFNWTPISKDDKGSGLVVYSTQFRKASGSKDFTLMAHLSRTTTTTTDPVACDGCANDTSGMCKSTADSTCTAATGVATDECGANFNLCTETSTVVADTLKFSIRLSGWNFASQSNKLQYTIDLKEPKGNKKDSDNISKKDGKTKRVSMEEGYIDAPEVATIHGGASPQDVSVGVQLSTNGGKQSMTFTFDAWPDDSELYYDPDIIPNGASRAASAAYAVGLLSSLAALVASTLL